jgi:hypothetical protein
VHQCTSSNQSFVGRPSCSTLPRKWARKDYGFSIGRLRNFRIVRAAVVNKDENINKQKLRELAMVANADPEQVEEVRGTITTYLNAVKANDIATLRGLFDGKANITHYHVKKDTVVINTLDEFMGVIQSLHAKFDNAEEFGEAMNVRLAKHLASVELDFCFVMGPNRLRSTDLFNVARQNGKWVIVHKSYWL